MISNALTARRSGMTALAAAAAICAAVNAFISAFQLWPIMSAYGPLCGETRTGALLHCPACYLAIGFAILAVAAALAQTASATVRRHAVHR